MHAWISPVHALATTTGDACISVVLKFETLLYLLSIKFSTFCHFDLLSYSAFCHIRPLVIRPFVLRPFVIRPFVIRPFVRVPYRDKTPTGQNDYRDITTTGT